MKKILISVLGIALMAGRLDAAKPLIGMVGISGTSARTENLSVVTERHIANIFKSTGLFDQVGPELLRAELGKFNCMEETCILRFARTAKIDIIIRGRMEDRGSAIVLSLTSFGSGAPYFGKIIEAYIVEIPVGRYAFSSQEFSYIAEEHAGRFISRLLDRFLFPVPISMVNGKPALGAGGPAEGKYTVYRFREPQTDRGIGIYDPIGAITLKKNEINAIPDSGMRLRDGDFILFSYKEKAAFVDSFYYGRKKEIVFDQPGCLDTLYLMLFTVPASISMPLIAPIAGYYQNNDYYGLSWWAVNAAPYLYLEYQGLMNRPDQMRKDHASISRGDKTRYYFGLYMALCGGMSLFVDAFAAPSLSLASNYQGQQGLLGNPYTCLYLSLVSGGGGHFYKGYRFEGYCYFHLNNVLLYYALREFARPERYNPATNSYERGPANNQRGFALLGVFGLVKAIEATHALLLRDQVQNGRPLGQVSGLSPVCSVDEDKGLRYGLGYVYAF